MLFEQFPYTNFHEINLDWLLKKVKDMEKEFEDYKSSVTTIIKDNLAELVFAAIYDPVRESIKINVSDPDTIEILERLNVVEKDNAETQSHMDALEKEAITMEYNADDIVSAHTIV